MSEVNKELTDDTIKNETVISTSDSQPNSDVNENIIGNMLPQVSLTGAASDPGTDPVDFINNDLQKEIDNSSTQIDDVIKQITMDNLVIECILDKNIKYDEKIESIIEACLDNADKEYNISKELIDNISKNAVLKSKLKNTIDKNDVIDLKRKMIENQKKINKYTKGQSSAAKKSTNKFTNDITDSIDRNIDRYRKEAKYKTITGTGPVTENISYLKDQVDLLVERYYESDSEDDLKAVRLIREQFEDAVKHELFESYDKENNGVKDIEDDIALLVKSLENKGYYVKYASPGHPSLVKNEDYKKDKVYYDSLYSDARIVFSNKYDFPRAPEYWYWKQVPNKVSYLDIKPLEYDGPDDKKTVKNEYYKWKRNYMNSLKDWIKELPYNNSKEVNESIAHTIVGSILKSAIASALLSFSVFGAMSIKEKINREKVKKILKVMPLYTSRHNLIPTKDVRCASSTIDDLKKVYSFDEMGFSKFLQLEAIKHKLELDDVENSKLLKTALKEHRLVTYFDKDSNILFITRDEDEPFILDTSITNEYADILASIKRYYVTPGFKKFCKTEAKYLESIMNSGHESTGKFDIIDDISKEDDSNNDDTKIEATDNSAEVNAMIESIVNENIENSDEAFGFDVNEETDTLTDNSVNSNPQQNNNNNANKEASTTDISKELKDKPMPGINKNNSNPNQVIEHAKISELKMRAFRLYHEGLIDEDKYDKYKVILDSL